MFLTIKLCTHAELTICIKMDLALNILQRLINPTNQPVIVYFSFLVSTKILRRDD